MAGVKALRDYCVSPHHPPMTDFVTSVQNLKDILTNVASMNIWNIVFSKDFVCSFLINYMVVGALEKDVRDRKTGSQKIFQLT